MQPLHIRIQDMQEVVGDMRQLAIMVAILHTHIPNLIMDTQQHIPHTTGLTLAGTLRKYNYLAVLQTIFIRFSILLHLITQLEIRLICFADTHRAMEMPTEQMGTTLT